MIEHTFPIAEQLMINALQLAQRLYQQLTQEADSLIRTPQASFISAVANNKRELVTQLDLFNKQLEQILVAEQLPHSPEGVEAYFQLVKISGLSADALELNWKQLIRLCNDCKHLNEQNGASIDILARNNKRTLHILKGKSENITSYGRDGAVISDFQNNTFVSV
jgi:flagella synthesis protein FlgN